MSEIEKLYINANIEKEWKPLPYGDIEEYYPEFTGEKQLEIVKQILFSMWWMNLKRLQFSEKFDEGLAQMINELWQDLTDIEKSEIKRILEL
jgi:hypothetical protein